MFDEFNAPIDYKDERLKVQQISKHLISIKPRNNQTDHIFTEESKNQTGNIAQHQEDIIHHSDKSYSSMKEISDFKKDSENPKMPLV